MIWPVLVAMESTIYQDNGPGRCLTSLRRLVHLTQMILHITHWRESDRRGAITPLKAPDMLAQSCQYDCVLIILPC